MPSFSSPEPYILWLTGAGVLIALVAWLPLALKRLPLSLPIICIGIGAVVFSLPAVSLRPLPMSYADITERFTEFIVIIALMCAGLKLDRVFSWRRWNVTWRLLAVTMPLSIAAITLLYLAYLRRQTRIEEQVRRRRAQRMARSRLGVENTRDDEFDVVPSRLRRPGAAVLEIDDEDPIFEHLEYTRAARSWDLPRAAGQ